MTCKITVNKSTLVVLRFFFIWRLQVDESLSFLDDLVSDALSNGSSPYRSASERNVITKNTGWYFAKNTILIT